MTKIKALYDKVCHIVDTTNDWLVLAFSVLVTVLLFEAGFPIWLVVLSAVCDVGLVGTYAWYRYQEWKFFKDYPEKSSLPPPPATEGDETDLEFRDGNS